MKKFKIKKRTIIVLILAIITFSNSYLIARYSSLVSGTNFGSVAKWQVSYDTSDNASDTINLISGNGTSSYIIKVTSVSEVAANYSIILSNVPSEMEVKIDNGVYETPINNRIEFNNVGSFSGNNMNTTFTHTLTFNAPLESNIASTTNIGVNIEFSQIN